MKVHRELRPLVKAARNAGWDVSRTSGGHVRFDPPNGRPVFGPWSASDWRSLKNLRAQLRRAGLKGA